MTTPTPGHGGKVCSDEQGVLQGMLLEWTSGRWLFRRFQGTYSHWTSHCPACGIRLVPDEEPLPVPEGFERVIVNISEIWVDILAIGPEKRIAWHFIGVPLADVEVAWRAAFGKKP